MDWTKDTVEPQATGTVTKTVRPTPPVDPLKAGIEMLGRAADAAKDNAETKVEEVRRSLAPVLKEAAALLKEFEDLDAMYRARLDDLARSARRSDLRCYPGIDRALEQLDRSANEALRMLSSGLRVLGDMPRKVGALKWDEVQTKKYLDFGRDVACLRDGPKYVRGCVEGCERLLKDIEALVAKRKPTRQLIEAVDPSKDPDNPKRRQERADSDYDPFPGTPEGIGNPQPFIL